MIGYSRIVFTNNSIPNTTEFNKLFDMHANLVEIKPFNWLPNLVKPELNKIYAEHMEDLTTKGEYYNLGILYHGLNDIAVQECLLHSHDQDSLVFVPDTDETFIPTKLQNFDYPHETFRFLTSSNAKLKSREQVARFESEYLSSDKCAQPNNSESFIKSYLKRVYQKYNISTESSLYLPQVLFLTNNITHHILSTVETTLLGLNKSVHYPIVVKVFQEHTRVQTKGFTFHSADFDVNFDIVINSDVHLAYAQNLINLNKYLIQPYLESNRMKLEKASERWTRFFYMDLKNDTDENIMYYVGNSFVNTKTSEFMHGPHVPKGPLYGTDWNHLFQRPSYHHQEIASYHISHFRDRYKMGKSAKPITRFHIDLNYFACYVKHLLDY